MTAASPPSCSDDEPGQLVHIRSGLIPTSDEEERAQRSSSDDESVRVHSPSSGSDSESGDIPLRHLLRRFPLELVQKVIQDAARSDFREARKLDLISKTVHKWVHPIVHAVVRLDTPRDVSLFEKALERSKGRPWYFAHHVHTLIVKPLLSPAQRDTIFMACPNIKHLTINAASLRRPSTRDDIKIAPTHINIAGKVSTEMLKSPVFSTPTHLRLLEDCAFHIRDHIPQIKTLTHSAFRYHNYESSVSKEQIVQAIVSTVDSSEWDCLVIEITLQDAKTPDLHHASWMWEYFAKVGHPRIILRPWAKDDLDADVQLGSTVWERAANDNLWQAQLDSLKTRQRQRNARSRAAH